MSFVEKGSVHTEVAKAPERLTDEQRAKQAEKDAAEAAKAAAKKAAEDAKLAREAVIAKAVKDLNAYMLTNLSQFSDEELAKIIKDATPARIDTKERDAEARKRVEELARELSERANKQLTSAGTGVRFDGSSAPSIKGLNVPKNVYVGLTQEGTVEIEAVPGSDWHPKAVKS